MNPGLKDDHASIRYYDGDYPSPITGIFPENFDETTLVQGLAHDIARYRAIAAETGGPILDLCCGTGRVTIPLARDGLMVTGVDISTGMLLQFRQNLGREDHAVQQRIELVEQDITRLDLSRRNYPLAIIAFNSLLCIPSFEDQMRALEAVGVHLANGGLLMLDLVNPLRLKIDGDPVPKPFFTRKNPATGNVYTRFAMMDGFDSDHRQRLHGWYDEIGSDGQVKRTPYSLFWRPIFRFELQLMLERAGFQVEAIEGGHQREPYSAQSPKMFVRARRL